MKIEFPLLSILSVCVLLFFGPQGDVELYSWKVGFSISLGKAKITVDPVWVVWANPLLYTDHYGFALGNVAVIEKDDRDTLYGSYNLAEETNHIEQFQALGFFVYPARLVLPIESSSHITNWNDSNECDRLMWLPSVNWIDQWHFIVFVL